MASQDNPSKRPMKDPPATEPASKRATRAGCANNDQSSSLHSQSTPTHQASVVENNTTISSFLRLPGELRNMIYESFICDHQIKIRREGGAVVGTKVIDNYEEDRAGVRDICILLHVCRQTRNETTTITYACNTFVFEKRACFMAWYKQRTQVQRGAVSRIGLSDGYPMKRRTSSEAFTKLLPGLQEVVLTIPQYYFEWRAPQNQLYPTHLMWLNRALKCFRITESDRLEVSVETGKYVQDSDSDHWNFEFVSISEAAITEFLTTPSTGLLIMHY